MTEPTAFEELSDYVALPRLGGLALSPDGTRLVTSVSRPGADGKKYTSSLWEVDPAGTRPARRLTRSAPGEQQPVFAPDGALLFTSKRPDPDEKEPDTEVPALWSLPAGGGEARVVATRPGGIGPVAVARDAGEVAFLSGVLPLAATAEQDEKARKARKDAAVSAILHEAYPVRHWDHDLGPAQHRVFVASERSSEASDAAGIAASQRSSDAAGIAASQRSSDAAGTATLGSEPADGGLAEPRDLTPDPQGRVGDEELAISPDGRLVAYAWQCDDGGAAERTALVVADAATGERRVTVDLPRHEHYSPAFSPDSASLVCCRAFLGDYDTAASVALWLVDLASGEGRPLAPDLHGWPQSPVFSADGQSIYFTADEQGHSPVFRLALADGTATRLTAAGGYTNVVVAPDGSAVYALGATVDSPPAPVRLDPAAPDQDPVPLRHPGEVGRLPGTVTEIRTTASDGTPLRAWLCLPHAASATAPAPLLLWIHGGPFASWNAWSWRWNPWLAVARGYAVLLPDPALSTGYGQAFIQRAWGEWGREPYTDLMALTDATCARPDIDGTRTAAMGGSFGGYMANWVATQTDRFKAIVTHASIWALDQFSGITDHAWYWQSEFGDPLHRPERYERWSPHRFVDRIRTPMLVIHGDKDYRVPIAEGVRLFYDLRRHGVESKYLYFPDENHWVLAPNHAKVWYETVFAFLAQHVLDQKWQRPDLL